MAALPTVTETRIPGLLVVDLPVHGDQRGWFKENWQREKMVAAGLPDFGPVQNNISFNTAVGTTRGIHAEPWDKYVSVAAGRIFGAWVDLREGEAFGRTVTLELDTGRAVYVPRGVGNSFQTLEPDTVYAYLVDDHWSADAQGEYAFLNLADETVGIDWPIPLERAELSAKDRHHPRLDQALRVRPAPLLITGANGQLGRELVRQCRERGIPHLAATRTELDLADPASWQDAYRWRSLGGIINGAADTAVDAAQTPEGRARAWAANATGAAALAQKAREAGLPFVQVSTDYVFDGSKPLGEYYAEEDAVAPLGVYGQSKVAGEAAAAVVARHYVVRTSWVIGEGKNFVATMASLARRGIDPAVVGDQYGRPTFTEDLAAGILHLLHGRAEPGTYHLTNAGEVITWADLAAAVYEATGHDPARVRPTTTAEYFAEAGVHAPRPQNSALDLARIQAAGFRPRDHREALAAYLAASAASAGASADS